MSVSSAGSSTSTSTTSSSTTNSLADLSQNYETFLRLLTAQLQNQDPLQPQDTAAFTNQLVQFSQVEQQIASNKKLDEMVAAINNGQPNQALGYIGKTVEIQSNGWSLQDGKAHLTVSTDVPAASSVLEITDSKTNKVVRTIQLTKTAGTQEVDWDGKDSSGNQLADGTYVANVKAKGSDGKAIEAQVLTFGKVTGVDLTATEPYLMLGNLPIKMTNVLSVK
jgi:flagellar basal-body rod modification protein FlgD